LPIADYFKQNGPEHYRYRAIVYRRGDQLQLTPKMPKPDTSMRKYVPQNNKTLFTAHLLTCDDHGSMIIISASHICAKGRTGINVLSTMLIDAMLLKLQNRNSWAMIARHNALAFVPYQCHLA